MGTRAWPAACAAAALLVTAACGAAPFRTPAGPAPDPQAQTALVAADNGLGLSLLSAVAGSAPQGNAIISPAGAAFDLAMVYAGAAGGTAQAMATSLGWAGLAPAQVAAATAALAAGVQGQRPGITLDVANAIWARTGTPLVPSFLRLAKADFGASPTTLDFTAPGAPATINAWVAAHTGGHIPQLVDHLNPDDVLLLVNALYFQGQWTTAFDPSLTHSRPFTLPSGQTADVPMMARTGRLPYAKESGFQLVELPYGNGDLVMDLVVPDQPGGLPGLLTGLDAARWQAWLGALAPATGQVVLPKMHLSASASLSAALQRLGMTVAFSRTADFSGMCTQGCRISDVVQKTDLTVDEQGTQAAAATSTSMAATAILAPTQPPFAVVADHGFLLAIRDRQTGLLLFAAAITDPRG